jgi:glycosidase
MTMLDVVGNHMGHSRSESYKDLKPFNKPEYYHKHIPGCDQWGDIPQSAYDARPANATLIEQCRLQSLPDLNQTVPFVRDQLLSWLERTLQKYDFDGLRVDTVKHVDPVRPGCLLPVQHTAWHIRNHAHAHSLWPSFCHGSCSIRSCTCKHATAQRFAQQHALSYVESALWIAGFRTLR